MARPPHNPQGNPQGPDPRQQPKRPYKPISGGQLQPQGYPQRQPSQPQPLAYPQPQPRPNRQPQPDNPQPGEPSLYPPQSVQRPRPVNPPPQQPPSGNYRQPNYPPQQPPVNRPPNGQPRVAYQGAAAAAKKGVPAWGWILISVITLGVLAGGGFAAWTYLIKPNATPTSQVGGPGASSGSQPGTGGSTVGSTGGSTGSSGGNPNGLGPKVSGPGQELVGQGGVDNEMKITITQVDRYTQFVEPDGTVINADGAFLVVIFDEVNVGNQEHSVAFVRVKDSTGQVFGTSRNINAVTLLRVSDVYRYDIRLQPGQKGQNYDLIEVPADATGFTAVFGL